MITRGVKIAKGYLWVETKFYTERMSYNKRAVGYK